ncbi:hypothetical protein [Micromonospora tulbaghiae]|uniref:hypothetical protein n=1 Tax=Micromonospora tulbaghiae TaxID=479978 RepID=UPI0013C537DE|nr:hypothetical protein [Micromonospora tulbaghiae]
MLEMHEVLPVLSVTVVPSVLLLAVAYPLRGQGGRRAAHFAAGRREPGLGAGR